MSYFGGYLGKSSGAWWGLTSIVATAVRTLKVLKRKAEFTVRIMYDQKF